MKILALDPSMTNFGWCVGRHGDNDGWTLISGGCIKTRSQASQSGVSTTEDQTRRIRYITSELSSLIVEEDVDLVAGEYQPGYTSKKTAKSSGFVVATIICTARFHGDKLLEWYQPSEVKKIVLKKRSGTKKEIREALMEPYPGLENLLGDTKYINEAVGDAAAVLHCSVESSDYVRALT